MRYFYNILYDKQFKNRKPSSVANQAFPANFTQLTTT